MEINTQIATTEYDKLVAQIKVYAPKLPEDIKKLPVDLQTFARQTIRRIGTIEANKLLSAAAGSGQ
jgi:hypothetical protein